MSSLLEVEHEAVLSYHCGSAFSLHESLPTIYTRPIHIVETYTRNATRPLLLLVALLRTLGALGCFAGELDEPGGEIGAAVVGSFGAV